MSNRERFGKIKMWRDVPWQIHPCTGVNRKGDGLPYTQVRTHKRTIYTCMPRWQRVVQRRKRGEKETESAKKKNIIGEVPPFLNTTKGVVACRSLQSKGRSNDHRTTQGSQLLSEMATNGVGGRWRHIGAPFQHTCITERQIKNGGPCLSFSHTNVPFVAPVVQHLQETRWLQP